jgi:hypothetical protein
MLPRRTQIYRRSIFLLGLMRNRDLPSDLRIKMAEVAVHRKPTKNNPQILAPPKHVALMKAVRKGKAAQPGGADPKAGKPGTLTVEGAAEEESPLQYLMGVNFHQAMPKEIYQTLYKLHTSTDELAKDRSYRNGARWLLRLIDARKADYGRPRDM